MNLHPITFIPGANCPAEQIQTQLRQNVRRDIPWLAMEPEKEAPLAIVAGGPSLKRRWPELYRYTDVLALNGAYRFLLERDVVPKYFMMLDARKENLSFLQHPCHQTRHFLAAQCHPECFDALQAYDTTLYLTVLPGTLEAVEGINKPRVQIAGTVGTVGIKALCLAYALGYREVHLFGYDSSYEDSHHAFEQRLNDDTPTIDIHLEGKRYITAPTFAHQAAEFCEFAAGLSRDHGMSIELHCDGLLPHMVDYSNRMGETPLELREKAKYQEIWTHDAYRKDAPGESFVYRAVKALHMYEGDTVIDYGCGTGRGAKRFQDFGMQVTGVDFAPNALETEIPFIESCLWDLPDIESDFAYCTDVMEHIPPEKVPDVIEGIAKRTSRGAFFNIATREDNLGRLIGRKLHMTVMTAEAWRQVLARYWDVEMTETEGEATFVCTEPLQEKPCP